ncbi:homospermidine synthase [Permianibacter sp. IMCC34836]|uniref:homospermidine synthase n=1 Tax=Permianibacter fluminis TaxID=2738515 RepID=UPI0015574BB8|nr:saccharopine dehydrogenase C-terminal domain-containing protein [Permianibacter fluminis]NQD37621.1 homospermidine synthase [Permianibacter fluminis]
MNEYVIHARAPGKIVMVGFGAIGQGVLPLILRHLGVTTDDITIVTADERGHDEAREYGIRFVNHALTRDNYREVLTPLLTPGTFMVNLSVDVSSIALVELCQQHQTLYIDTCIEPWAGGYTDPHKSLSERSNYAFREQALALRQKYPNGRTAIFANGANPGMVSHLLKQALLNLHHDIHGEDTQGEVTTPTDRNGWAKLAQKLNIKTIHVAERDTQITDRPKQMNEFVNTWSVDGFVGEGCQPAELGWGSHERHFPSDGSRHEFGCGAAIFLKRPGATVRVRTWTPDYGPFHGFLITHNEAISISDYLTVREGDKIAYRPTCHYSYHPCDSAVVSLHEFNGRNFKLQPKQRILRDEITDGMDELGVLLAGHAKGAYWFGSQLTAKEAKTLAPHNSATTLQVTSAVLAGMVWAIENPQAGIVEAEDMDFQRTLEVQKPYLGKLLGQYTDWTPLQHRNEVFAEDVDGSDPWQFKNVRVL